MEIRGAIDGYLRMIVYLQCNANNRAATVLTLGTFRYEDGKARMARAVDAGNFRGSCCAARNKMLKMFIFGKDGDINNLNFTLAIHRCNDIL